MIVPDINLLIYAYDPDSPNHAKAATWWAGCLSGNEPVGLLPSVVFGFLRIATSARVFHNPMTVPEATGHIRSWLEQPVAQILELRRDHVERTLELIEALGAAGNLVTDAGIAASIMEYNATLHTNDTDFMRFAGLRTFNPLRDEPRSRRRRG